MSWKKCLLIILLVLSQSPAYADWGEGWDPVDPPVATTAPEGKVEVIEFFWYGCPHCFHLEPELGAWLKKKPDNVVFTRVPLPLNPNWTVHAYFYYAAEVLGVADQLHGPLFEAIQEKKRKLFDKQSLIDFAVEQGIDREKFTAAWDSFGVYAKVLQARKLGQRYGIDGVPAVGIDGRYRTSASLAGSYKKMFEIIDRLVANAANPSS